MQSGTPETLNHGQLLTSLYQCVAEPEQWPDFLSEFCRIGRFDSATLRIVGLQEPQVHQSHVHGLRDDLLPQLVTKDPYRAHLLANPVGKVLCSHDFLTDKEYEQTDHYQAFFRPQNRFYAMGTILSVKGDRAVQIGMHRSRPNQSYQPQDRAFLASLVPQLQQAIRLQGMLGQLHASVDQALCAMDHLPIGVCVVTKDGLCEWSNAKARAIMSEQWSDLSMEKGRFRLRTGNQQMARRFWQFVDQPDGALTLRLNETGMHIIMIGQYTKLNDGLNLGRDHVLMFLVDPSQPVLVHPDRMSLLFGLTPAECRLIGELLRGLDLPESADRLCLSIHTVRSHLKSIQRKTGCHRQSELMRKLLLSNMTGQVISNEIDPPWSQGIS